MDGTPAPLGKTTGLYGQLHGAHSLPISDLQNKFMGEVSMDGHWLYRTSRFTGNGVVHEVEQEKIGQRRLQFVLGMQQFDEQFWIPWARGTGMPHCVPVHLARNSLPICVYQKNTSSIPEGGLRDS